MRLDTKKIVDRLEVVIQLDDAPRRLRDVVEAELVGSFSLSAAHAAEKSESLEARIVAIIEQREGECDRAGRIPRLSITGTGSPMVAGACYVFPSDPPHVASLKRHRTSADPLLQRVISLTPDEFERFGAKVLKELGAQKAVVTRQSNDQGIDFYGVMNIGRLTAAPEKFLRLAHDLELRFAGQAKHYPANPLGTNVVRELAGAVSLARHKTFSNDRGDDLFEELELLPLNPLVAMLFTTGRFTSGARDLAAKAGIIARSGDQLATFLADRGVGMIDGSFSATAFDSWLLAPD